MRMTPRLLHVASLLLATGYGVACGGSTSQDSDAGTDASTVGCGCSCGSNKTVDVTAAQACTLVEEAPALGSLESTGAACQAFCPSPYVCSLPSGFVADVESLNPDPGPKPDDGGLASLQCPSDAGTVTISCVENCVGGRLTQGYDSPKYRGSATTGDRFAAMAFLEAVSVHAFERLERELAAHGANAEMLNDVRRARRDEIRHTAITARLARERGASIRMPDAPKHAPIRRLLDVAVENAVEGCVRETYGAVLGLVEAETAADPSTRRAMRSLAIDECRHAELAWAVHAWALPQLTSVERLRVETAMRDAVGEIAARDARTAALLFSFSADRSRIN